MNLKNHTGLRPIVLQGEQNEVATFSHGHTFPWYCKTLPATTNGRLANYLIGFLVTVVATFNYTPAVEGGEDYIDWDDVARGLFESFELKNCLMGKPISHNYARGESLGLWSFLCNGMRRPIPQPRFLSDLGTGTITQRVNYFVPVASLLGMKGHHTAPLACLFDGATFEIKSAAVGALGASVGTLTITNGTLRVTAMLQAEPEIRLGPGVQWIRYEKTVSAGATKHMIEALGNTSSLQSVDGGAGIAFLGWMTNQRGWGGSFSLPANLEYVNLPFRGLDQLVTLDPLFADYLGSCDNESPPVMERNSASVHYDDFAGPFATSGGGLYRPGYNGDVYGILGGAFVPLVSPRKYMEVTKLQVVEGTQELNAKVASEAFNGNDVFYALQYHSWTPAMQENFLRRVVDSGLARAVWGTNDLKPKSKLLNKQPSGGLNLSKTRFLPITWEPQEQQVNPPGPASAK